MPIKLNSALGGSVSIDVPSTSSAYTLTAPTRSGTIITSADSNTVNTNMISTGAITLDKLGTTTKLVKFTQITNNTRQSFTQSTEYTFWSPSYTKERSDSSLLIQMSLATYGNYSYCLNWYARYAGSSWVLGTMPNVASSVGYSMRQANEYLLTGITNTGSNTLDIKWNTVNAQAGNAPASIWNPNASDESRLTQNFSSLNIWEII